jgi:hypothetical protein
MSSTLSQNSDSRSFGNAPGNLWMRSAWPRPGSMRTSGGSIANGDGVAPVGSIHACTSAGCSRRLVSRTVTSRASPGKTSRVADRTTLACAGCATSSPHNTAAGAAKGTERIAALRQR